MHLLGSRQWVPITKIYTLDAFVALPLEVEELWDLSFTDSRRLPMVTQAPVSQKTKGKDNLNQRIAGLEDKIEAILLSS